jgi:hypothetical protein
MTKPSLFALALLFALAGCVKPPAEKGPAPDYQMKSAQSAPANIQQICYDQESLTAYNERMLQQELAVGALTCQNSDGSRKYDKQYGDVLNKFSGDLSSNAVEIRDITTRRHLNLDVVVTEFANREARWRNDDPQFCSRVERAFAWALSPKVTSLAQVPPPHDLGPEMNAFPCQK